MIGIGAVVGIALGAFALGGALGFAGRGALANPSEVREPEKIEAQAGLEIAQWPAIQIATAEAMSEDPAPCALEYAGLLAVVQGGQQAQAMGALEAASMSRRFQECTDRIGKVGEK